MPVRRRRWSRPTCSGVIVAPPLPIRSPIYLWSFATRQNAYAERLIGSLRRERLDHVVVLGEIHLLRILAGYFEYYNRARCHFSLAGDAPEPRLAQEPELGWVVELPEVGGLHHGYERSAA